LCIGYQCLAIAGGTGPWRASEAGRARYDRQEQASLGGRHGGAGSTPPYGGMERPTEDGLQALPTRLAGSGEESERPLAMRYVLGLDLGTSSLKAMLVDANGGVAASATQPYAMQSPRPGWTEQDPRQWWNACAAAIRQLLSQAGEGVIAAVGIGGQMHGTVLLDRAGDLLRPAIIWPDTRAATEARQAQAALAERGLLERLGGGVSPGFMLASLLWCRTHEPDVWRQVTTALLPKDYLRFRLTGLLASEASDGTGIPAIELATGAWCPEALACLALPSSLLPPLCPSGDVAGHVSAEASVDCGLRAGTPVLAGASDQATAAIGAGLLHPGSMLISLSTGGTLVTPVSTPIVLPSQGVRTLCHALSSPALSVSAPVGAEIYTSPSLSFSGGYLAHSAVLNVGLALRWLRQTCFEGRGAEETDLLEAAERAPAGAAGLLFLPYLAGERSPVMDPEAGGVLAGLRLHHERAHLARAALEGIAFSLRQALEPLHAAGAPASRVLVAGGLAQSPLMRRILASVLDMPLVPLAAAEQSALGGALLAAVAAGFFRDLDQACEAAVRYEPAIEPEPALVACYRSRYALYRELYPALRHTLRALHGPDKSDEASAGGTAEAGEGDLHG
jgi:xylulokinase